MHCSIYIFSKVSFFQNAGPAKNSHWPRKTADGIAFFINVVGINFLILIATPRWRFIQVEILESKVDI